MRSRAWLFALVLPFLIGLGACASDTDTPSEAPNTDIHLATYSINDGRLVLDTLVNRTQRTGYDNQPQFTANGASFLYTSERAGATDIYEWPLDDDTPQARTVTETSEYSPTPRTDTTFTVVRVEDDGAQRLWELPMGSNFDETLLLPDVEPVGYFAWADPDRVAMFVLGEPNTLQWADLDAGTVDTLRTDIGPSLQALPHTDHAISAVDRTQDGDSLIVVRSPTDIEVHAPALEGDADHAWTPDGHLLMTSGTALYQWEAETAEWREVYDWAPATPSRIAVSPTEQKLAIVVAPPDDV